MPDDAVVDGGATADAGADEGTSDAAPDLQTIADQFDAEALAESPIPAGTEAGQSSGKGGAPPASADPLDVFIQQNYNGDPNALIHGIYESRAEAKRLAEEVKELRGRTAPPPPPRDVEAEVKSRFDRDPEVQAIDQDIKSIDKRYQTISATQSKLGEEASTLAAEISKIEGQLLNADDIEKPRLLHEKGLKHNRLGNIQTEFNNNNNALETLSDRYKDKHKELQRAERQIRESLDNESRADSVNKRLTTQTRTAFAGSFEEVAQGYGLVPETPAYNFMRESMRTQLRDYLESQGDEAALDANGIHEAVTKLMAAAATAGFVRRKVAATTKPTPRVTPRPTLIPRRPLVTPTDANRPSAAAPARTSDENQSDPDYWRRRADHILKTATSQPRGRGR